MSDEIYLTNDSVIDTFKRCNYVKSTTAEVLNISYTAFKNLVSQRPELDEALKDMREEMVDSVEASMIENALNGNVTAAKYILDNLGKSRGYNVKREQTFVDDSKEVLTIMRNKKNTSIIDVNTTNNT